jgi:hypothetical protein
MLQYKPYTEPATVLITGYLVHIVSAKGLTKDEFIIITTTNIINKEHSKSVLEW